MTILHNFKLFTGIIAVHLSKDFKLKFIYSEKATKFCEIFPLLLTTVHTVKSKGNISQNFVAFSEYIHFTKEVQLATSKDIIIYL